jgi:predicted polyphosphate/ATP-dependent NAD kinase
MVELGGQIANPGRLRVGLVVNPMAGLGGRVGLKGTDGPATAEHALELGAIPEADARAASALTRIRARWPRGIPHPMVVTVTGPMGDEAVDPGLDTMIVAEAPRHGSTAADTRRVARALVSAGVDLLLFAGGDGTARDVTISVGGETVVLGIPAGVKMHSDVFALSPTAAGDLAIAFLIDHVRRTREGEVLDLDETAYRRGVVAPRLVGYLRVPAGPQVQGRKSPSPANDAVAMASIAADVVESFEVGRRYILGPGTTLRAIAVRAGVAKTLVGVDVLVWSRDHARLLVADARAAQLEVLIGEAEASIIVTPIGGQGFVFGRGNQPLSPSLIRAVGRDRLIVVATPAKLEALAGRPLLVDTGDADLDAELAGPLRVVTGYRERAVVSLAAA